MKPLYAEHPVYVILGYHAGRKEEKGFVNKTCNRSPERNIEIPIKVRGVTVQQCSRCAQAGWRAIANLCTTA
jgi:hypothetical protein